MVRLNPPTTGSTLDRPHTAAEKSAAAPLLADARCDSAHGRTTVVISREFPNSESDVWSLLTDPVKLAAWAPFTADRNLSAVGRATLTMLDGGDPSKRDLASVVFTAEAPRTLEYSWAEDTVAWSLEDAVPSTGEAAGTRLTLRQTLANPAMASAVAAGWHLCLDVAASVLDGHPIPAIRGMAAMDHGWADLNRRYAAKLGVKPSRIG
jgi:uncharacterized protein YndB with AHSA1/START domain